MRPLQSHNYHPIYGIVEARLALVRFILPNPRRFFYLGKRKGCSYNVFLHIIQGKRKGCPIQMSYNETTYFLYE
ncbi:MAG: hypothetical protein FWH18_07560 [Marinilabiliaceae bacterium]|nr:hypothetical protein [Marinilabiliaceae bacterium]